MATFKCKMCGGTIEFSEGASVGVCDYCGTKQTLPRLDNDKKANLYDRANHFRRNNDFDKAMNIYEQILSEDSTDAEAYWSLVLCRYGIEYVEDPESHKRIPTINRAQFTSVFDDDNYKSALQYADVYQRSIYEEEAKAINDIQKGILAISQKEEPFDVFICYKETDANGRRTQDSVLANDLYHQLTQEGFKVFFSRITLEDKLGMAYEPYIFAALNSAKVMVVLGTKPEHFNAVWVKNEWSRYLALVKNSGGKKILIPAYKDMDPYDLPEEFSHLQAQDMSKLGFMQDLIRGIKKITQADAPKTTVVKETVISDGNANTAPLLKRAFMFLEDSDWKSADEYCEKVLDQEPECAEAYLGKLMAELKVSKKANLKNCAVPFDDKNNYKKAIRFGDNELVSLLNSYTEYIKERNENDRLCGIYNAAKSAMENAAGGEEALVNAAEKFNSISGFKDSKELAVRCRELANTKHNDGIYNSAKAKMSSNESSDVEAAAYLFEKIPGWRDSDELAKQCLEKCHELREQESARRMQIMRSSVKAARIPVVECGSNIFGLRTNGTVVAAIKEINSIVWNNVISWSDIIAISSGRYGYDIVGLISDGTAVAGHNYNNTCNVSGWRDIIAVSMGTSHAVGLRSDGTVVATGENKAGQCNVSGWRDIVAISAGDSHTVGLRSDGTVVAVGDKCYNRCRVSGWRNIIAISAGYDCTIGLKLDGTVVAAGSKWSIEGLSEWRDIVAISASSGVGYDQIVGLKSDGTVVSTRSDFNIADWSDIVAVTAGAHSIIGLNSKGKVVVALDDLADPSLRKITSWSNLMPISNAQTFEEEKQIIKKSKEEKRVWRSNGVCQYCGGTFKGLFSKKCSVCGKPKDY